MPLAKNQARLIRLPTVLPLLLKLLVDTRPLFWASGPDDLRAEKVRVMMTDPENDRRFRVANFRSFSHLPSPLLAFP